MLSIEELQVLYKRHHAKYAEFSTEIIYIYYPLHIKDINKTNGGILEEDLEKGFAARKIFFEEFKEWSRELYEIVQKCKDEKNKVDLKLFENKVNDFIYREEDKKILKQIQQFLNKIDKEEKLKTFKNEDKQLCQICHKNQIIKQGCSICLECSKQLKLQKLQKKEKKKIKEIKPITKG